MAYALEVRSRWAVALTVVVVAFLAYSLPPYFSGGTRVPPTFGMHHPLLVVHVMLGSVTMVCAVAQIWPGLRGRHPALHRRTGRIYIAAAIPAASCAMVIGAATPFGPVLAASNVTLGALWLWYTGDGFVAGRARRFGRHRRQMLLSATLALSVISNRLWGPLLYVVLQPLRDSVFGGDETHFMWLVTGATGWLGWTVPFLVVRRWVNRHTRVTSPQSPSATLEHT